MFTIPKSIQATVTLLENIDIILQKTPEEDIETDILPIVYAGLESNTLQVQVNLHTRLFYIFEVFPLVLDD